MVIMWSGCDPSVVLMWSWCGSGVILLCFSYGHNVVPIQLFCLTACTFLPCIISFTFFERKSHSKLKLHDHTRTKTKVGPDNEKWPYFFFSSFFSFFAEETELQINAIIAAQTERYKLFICLWGLSQATLTRFFPLLTTYLPLVHIY